MNENETTIEIESSGDFDDQLLEGGDSLAADLDDKISFTYHIIDTHFSTFSYIDTKLQALLAVSSLFLAGATYIFTSYTILSVFSQTLFLLSGLTFILAILVCVWHIAPKMNSGIGNENNLRSAVGTSTLSKQEYHTKILSLHKNDLLRLNCYQISGLSRINSSGAIAMKTSSIAIAVGLSFFILAVVSNGIPKKNTELTTHSHAEEWSSIVELLENGKIDNNGNVSDTEQIQNTATDISHGPGGKSE